MSRLRQLPLLVAAALTAACSDSTAPVPTPAAIHDLVFESTASVALNQPTLFRLLDGETSPGAVFGPEAYIAQPDVSADGKRLVFMSPKQGSDDLAIWISDADGAGAVPIYTSTTHTLGSPALSPDGRRVAFTKRDAVGGSSVWIMDADGRNERPVPLLVGIPEMPIVHTYPSWSPDGKRLAISAGLPGHLQLYTTLVDGPGQLSPVTQSAVSDVEASWSPSGGELVFARTSTPAQSDLVIVNLATHGERVLHVERNARQPAWSPNGDLIAFSGRNPGGPTDIYTVSVQSGVVRQMTASAVADRHPSWARQLR